MLAHVGDAAPLDGAALYELIAPAVQGGKGFAGGIVGWLRLCRQRGRHVREHAGVDGIGLGEEAGGTGKIARAARVETVQGVPCRTGEAPQLGVVGRGCLQDDGAAGRQGGEQLGDLGLAIGDAPGAAAAGVMDIEPALGDVDGKADWC